MATSNSPHAVQHAIAPLSVPGLTKRAARALINEGIDDIRELMEWTEHDVRALPGLGAASAVTLRHCLSGHGLNFRPCERTGRRRSATPAQSLTLGDNP